jgi:hypothetical protein
MSTFRALLHPQILSGPWQLFVVLDGPAATWPEYVWPDGHPVPTREVRTVRLLAAVTVEPIGGEPQ